MSSPNYLVTGGAGFIGSHIVERLLADGASVRVVDDLSTGLVQNLAPFAGRIEFVEGDLAEPGVADRATVGIDTVFHLAALGSVPRSVQNAWASHHANVNATVRLLEACRTAKVRRVVYSSSSSVYGDTPTLPKHEELEMLPRSPYAASKLAGEQYVLAYARGGLLEGIALRYFNVFGPRQRPDGPYAAVIPRFFDAARHGHGVEIYGDGSQTRDFTYVDNVVDANLCAASVAVERANGTVVNVGAGGRTSLLELHGLVEEVSGRRIAITHREPRAGDVRDSLASLERARAAIGYAPRVSLREGLRRTWEAMTD
jgi:UDP-glucose 4-epimerase